MTIILKHFSHFINFKETKYSDFSTYYYNLPLSSIISSQKKLKMKEYYALNFLNTSKLLFLTQLFFFQQLSLLLAYGRLKPAETASD